MITPLILTIDLGTSSTRTMLFDATANAIGGGTAQIPYRVHTTPDGGAEFAVEALFDAVCQAIDQTLAQVGPLAAKIGAVAIDTMVTNILGVDAAGNAVTPVLTYADTRSAPQARQLRHELGEDGLQRSHNRVGTTVHASYLPSRFRWMAAHRPAWLAQSTRWVSVGAYLFHRLFGQWQVSYSAASWTGLLNRHTLTWDAEWLARLNLDAAQFSPLTDTGAPLRGLQSAWAKRWPALQTVPWFPAIGDGAAANIGSGCIDATNPALTIGTSGAMRVVVPANLAHIPAGLWLYRVDAKRGLLGGATSEGGNLYAWFKESLRLPPADELEQALAQTPPATHNLTVLPFISGERAPGWRGDARAAISGISLNTKPIDIVRAGLESVALRFALIYQRISAHLPPDPNRRVIAGGGVLNSPAWLQIIADVLGLPVTALAEAEATSRGTALLALEAMGIIDDIASYPPKTAKTYHPTSAHHALYQRALQAQLQAYKALIQP